ncbi:hypothetical protein KM043_006067 [Ampulex compressa]|nr:hypothetical protein KM043_006067 [Ampulex compressa]
MSINANARHYPKCIFLIGYRQLTDSAAGKDNGGNVTNLTNKLLFAVNVSRRIKMSMQNQSKFLSQLKDYFNKSAYDKNLQNVLSKEWLEFVQRVTYMQINTVKKLSSSNVDKTNISDGTFKTDEASAENAKDIGIALTSTDRQQMIEALGEDFKIRQEVPENAKGDPQSEARDQSSMFPQVLTTLALKLTNRGKGNGLASTPKWKAKVYTDIPKHCIASRTRHIVSSITTAESNASKWRRIEDLLAHIDQYPEARHYAIKEGAIRILLRARQKSRDEQITESIKEALAVLGYVDPVPGRGIRILSIDGGGIRGLLVIEMLKKLEELTGRKTHEMFDYICGVSTGAILAAVLGGHKRKSLSEISELYKKLSAKVFTQSALKGTSSLVWSHAYYDTALWERLLQEHLGEKILIKTIRDPNAPKFSAISAVVNHARVMAFVFRNYTLPHRVESQYIGSHKHKLWEAVRASAAAPSYFEEFKYGEYLHQDGGILVNNPCAVAIHEAKQLWPNNPIQCVVSFGTGRTPNRVCENEREFAELAISSWREKFYKILDSATDTEAVHTMLNDLLPDHVYFRFNPYLTEMLSMVEIRPEKLGQLEQDAKMYIRRNEDKFQKAAIALSEKRQIQQKLADWITLQRQISGL